MHGQDAAIVCFYTSTRVHTQCYRAPHRALLSRHIIRLSSCSAVKGQRQGSIAFCAALYTCAIAGIRSTCSSNLGLFWDEGSNYLFDGLKGTSPLPLLEQPCWLCLFIVRRAAVFNTVETTCGYVCHAARWLAANRLLAVYPVLQ
jgi:hypothetical protein